MRNVLRNPGFELGDTGWSKQPGWTIEKDTANARTGSWLAKFTGTSAAEVRNNTIVTFRPGLKTTLSAFYDGSAATAGAGEVNLWFLNKDQSILSVDFGANQIAFGQTGYIKSELIDSVAPAGTKFIRGNVRIIGSPDGSTWLVDDASLTGDIIEEIPVSVKIASHRLIPGRTVGSFEPLIGETRFQDFNAGRSDSWSGRLTFIPDTPSSDLRALSAFLQRLGRTGLFLIGDPDRRAPKNGIVNGMVVDGAGQLGNEMLVRGGPVNTTALVAGDMVEVRDQLYELQSDLEIGPEGTGVMQVWPAIRTAPADGEDVITDDPKMVARVTSDIPRSSDAIPVTEFSISFQER